MKTITVVSGIVKYGNLILCVQRPNKGLHYIANRYEFPGGKIEPGETEIEALKRELKEELNIEPLIGERCMTVHHQYPDFKLYMICYLCTTDTQIVDCTEHQQARWVLVENLYDLDWLEADYQILDKLYEDDFPIKSDNPELVMDCYGNFQGDTMCDICFIQHPTTHRRCMKNSYSGDESGDIYS